MKITSPAFENDEQIPQKYTCDGEDINPPLKFEDIPEDTASLALIVADPDAAGKKPFYHWVLFDMDVGTDHIDEDSVPTVAFEGKNDFNNTEYGGPCPSSGTHRYVFTLYALDGPLNLEEGSTDEEVLEAMERHVIDTAQLTGIYDR